MAENPTPNATPGAVAHAEATGVDLSTVTGTGAGGAITKADVAAAAAAAAAPAAPAASNWYYNLDPKHPAPNLLDESRFFQWDNPTVCPEFGGKQVSAIPVPAKGVYPTEIIALSARLDQR